MTAPALADVALRPATPEDRAFLLSVYAAARAAELDQVAWPPGVRESFLEMQFNAQDGEYHRLNPDASFDVVVVAGERAGRLYVDRRPGELRVIDISLLPAFRGRGLGGAILAGLQEEAAAAGRIVSLQVELSNPAARLYERLGFELVQDLGVYRCLEWRP
jgi:ribosomal protein S18 acetylase RimI-like enzyme